VRYYAFLGYKIIINIFFDKEEKKQKKRRKGYALLKAN